MSKTRGNIQSPTEPTLATCCGKARHTAFCSDCGRKLSEHCLASLLRFCEMHAATADRWYSVAREDFDGAMKEAEAEGLDVSRPHFVARSKYNRLKKATATKEKWDGWIAGLKAAIGE